MDIDVLLGALHGYLFPYFEIEKGAIYRCLRFEEDICCIEVIPESSGLKTRVLFGNCRGSPLELFVDPRSHIVLKDFASNIGVSGLKGIDNYALIWSPDWYEILISAIISQNTTFLIFRDMLRRFVYALGEKVGENLWTFPTPEKVVKEKNKISKLGLGYRGKLIIEVSKMFIDSRPVEEGETMEIVKKMVKIKGIGFYTATSYTLFYLKRYDTPLWDGFIAKKIMGEMLGYKVSSFKDFEALTRDLWGDVRGLIIASLVALYYMKSGRKSPASSLFEETK